MTVRRRLSRGGKLCLLAAGAFLFTAILFGHPFPALAGGLAIGLLLVSLPGGGALARLSFLPMAPARLVEDEERVLELDYVLTGASAPLDVRIDARGPAVEMDAGAPTLLPSPLGRVPVRVKALKRGHWERVAFDVDVRGPLAFLTRGANYDVRSDVWVVPRPRALRERVLEEMLSLRPRGIDRPQPSGPGEGEFYAIKDWREGESERRVHARLSARRGKKVMRIFRGEAPPLVHLLVDPRVGQRGRAFGAGDFDEALRFTAGVVKTLLKRDVPISLSLVDVDGGATVACPANCRDLHSFLGALAEAKPLPTSDPPGLPRLPRDLEEGRRVIVHLGQVDELRLSREWLAIRAGSQRYYQLLDMQLGARAPDGAAVVAASPVGAAP